MDTLRFFKWDFAVLVAALGVAFWYDGAKALSITAILIVVEIVFSFDNAAVNAKYLQRLNAFWQRMFLTVGILIAVFGMRLVFPFVIVCITGSISPMEAIRLAGEKGSPDTPGTYAYILDHAHPSIAAFGGMFLLLLFLDFLFDDEREIAWLKPIERPLMKVGSLDMLSVVVAGAALLVAAETLTDTVQVRSNVLFSGLAGLVTYLAVNGLADLMESREEEKDHEFEEMQHGSAGQDVLLAGKAAFSLFLFLEVLDATFSFDGVIGAFAVTQDPIIIALGLGVGALFVRSMTIYLVRKGTLAEYRYLEHGAHWAIGALAVMLLLTIKLHVGDIVIGLIGITFIGAAWLSSVRANKKDAAEGSDLPEVRAEHLDHVDGPHRSGSSTP